MKKHPVFLLPSNLSPPMGYIQSEDLGIWEFENKSLKGSAPNVIGKSLGRATTGSEIK